MLNLKTLKRRLQHEGVGDDFSKIDGQAAHINSAGLTRTQADGMVSDIMQIVKEELGLTPKKENQFSD